MCFILSKVFTVQKEPVENFALGSSAAPPGGRWRSCRGGGVHRGAAPTPQSPAGSGPAAAKPEFASSLAERDRPRSLGKYFYFILMSGFKLMS